MSLDYAGFKAHRAGRIHILCTGCGRKVSNMARTKDDPPGAVLMHLPCENCSEGCKVDGPSRYLDARGRQLDMGLWCDGRVRWIRKQKRTRV